MRTVRLEHTAQLSLDSDVAQYRRFDEVYRGMEWLLSNDPMQGDPIGDGFRLCSRGSQWASTPDILVAYTFTDDEVVIYDIKAVPSDESREC